MTKIKCGLEIHGYVNVENKTKLFCNCSIDENAKPNTNICPICTAMPGSKPMLANKEAVDKIIAIALMLGCKVNKKMLFQRKHYSWPDLPAGYQKTISGSYSNPVGVNGKFLGIKIADVHLEEDPARWDPVTGEVDYNRSGTPLVEIVTEPDFESTNQLRDWLKSLLTTLNYIKAINKNAGVKADTNVSIEPNFNRVEVKNVNSFSNIVKAAEYEILRQEESLKEGKKIEQETRAFDEKNNKTVFMRSKEQAADYMFIPEPDLPVIKIDDKYIERIRKTLPEKPDEKIKRLTREYKIKKEDAFVLCSDIVLSELFEKVTKKVSAEIAARWLRFELLRVLNYHKKELEEVKLDEKNLIELLLLVENKKITEPTAKKLIEKLVEKPFDVKKYVKQEKLESISDTDELEQICKDVIKNNQKVVDDYKNGRKEALNYLVGQVMRTTKGKASPKELNELFKKLID
ncbi:MAG: Asp-tRNA(Asn)/Glu-tRNA(Gln) amidotransferase subunit GatB [Candidatus Nanoarchaeia archaeon]|nr:Asp-tRNA(Asn)/Glu-tRNA(Gln) amidotransferase subunit GatB [Candidatus Nanoarchaeia archaeon]